MTVTIVTGIFIMTRQLRKSDKLRTKPQLYCFCYSDAIHTDLALSLYKWHCNVGCTLLCLLLSTGEMLLLLFWFGYVCFVSETVIFVSY